MQPLDGRTSDWSGLKQATKHRFLWDPMRCITWDELNYQIHPQSHLAIRISATASIARGWNEHLSPSLRLCSTFIVHAAQE